MTKYCLLIYLVFPLFSLGQSREAPLSGSYTMKIRVHFLDGIPLEDYRVIHDRNTLTTDSLGYVSIEIDWSYYRLIKWNYRRKYNKILNGKYIFLRGLNRDNFFVKNKWRKYGLKSRGNYYEVDVYSRMYHRF